MIDNSTEVQAIFNRIAPVYDQLNDTLSLGLHKIWKQMAVMWSEANDGDTCLDLCCGSGDLAWMLAKCAGSRGLVYGVDFSVEQLVIARNRRSPLCSQISPINWVEADALNLPFAENYFDCATMGYGLRNVLDIPRCLQELYRVLKPNSQAAILDMHRPSASLVRSFQQWYLDTVVVPVARNLDLTQEYAYISPSLTKFPTGQEQEVIAYQAGFVNAKHYPIAGGMMGILVITK
ncbi:MAG: bifunctional demethylmenaquinone methyltransferase/2-methoxy-6-polyprenyl-1,4-benzoquinol methylase UbiE [Okeania sp. SIO3B5]|uniref:bifunctional demethylmenaquinone methyltransferase/2-methoxy-6-polyprenyl-1,4-benzoquinol methylase UbiE n=1 Tax=Okeania sp. SIO3B5 TaxID=2607811 RepID=UPI001401BA72|nr:bifunctional demethylmenaquinone methyltransferase/2-methoxy-6-polyprenyl-1,4-benzoquinol methylase UbiE [Okeania sp. SIO3B5]NEO57434.1 bifunctional demethylmenaquinone methyltransferase/2-methoxy-6-polyprenyl-1,4-benzoquinol methylase UbiE [Okeania sp. SIO3B5]